MALGWGARGLRSAAGWARQSTLEPDERYAKQGPTQTSPMVALSRRKPALSGEWPGLDRELKD